MTMAATRVLLMLAAMLVALAEPQVQAKEGCEFPSGRLGLDQRGESVHTTATNSPLPFNRRFNMGSIMQGVFIDPARGFAFCTMEKNGCSQWDTIFRKMWTKDLTLNEPNYFVPHQAFRRYGPEGMQAVFSNPNAIRAVFVRDPLERFASAFLDKCIVTCSSCVVEPFCGKWTMMSAVKWALATDLANYWDGHWRLQSGHCELAQRLKEYNFVGFIKKETYARDASCLLERAGLSEFNTRGPEEGGRRIFERAQALRPTTTSTDQEAALLKKLFTTEAARELIHHMRQDYATFGFAPEPEWVKGATGEWYDYRPSDASEWQRGSFLRQAVAAKNATCGGEADELDLLSQAACAGFPLA